MRSIYFSEFATQQGTNLLRELFPGTDNLLDYPKPTELIKHIAGACTHNGGLILDFFSGSATTAHAVMRLNAEDGGDRKFIMVQVPEPCGEGTEAARAGYKNICEIGKERIRRAGAKLAAEYADGRGGALGLEGPGARGPGAKLDTGFRVLKLDSPNTLDVRRAPGETAGPELEGLVGNIKEGRTDEDLLFQVMLESGIPLSAPIEARGVGGGTVFFVDGARLAACFGQATEEIIGEIARAKPETAAFRDSGFSSDGALHNMRRAFGKHSPNTRLVVL
jgi:adenine-specific DNA-methyltransferase